MISAPEKSQHACPSRDDLRALSLGHLNELKSSLVLSHVDTCETCQEELDMIDGREDSLIANLRSGPLSDSIEDEPECELAVAKALGALSQTNDRVEAKASFPKSIGEYNLIRSLGYGGMGRVFLAKHTKLGREVALKLIADHRLGDESIRRRFENEMKAIGRLSHPNIVAAHDAREIDSTAVLVTEYIDGLDLGQIVRRTGPLSISDACAAMQKVAVALQYTHDQGFVHRDVKPSNVMISRDGQVKVLDLGLARLQDTDRSQAEMTGTGQTMGTADYVSPEQVTDSRDVDIRSDLYSLGCTLWKLLIGRPPFDSDQHATAFAKMNAHVSELAPKLEEHRAGVPKELAKLMDQLLRKDPDHRPKDPMTVARTLTQFSEGANLQSLVETAVDVDEPTASDNATPRAKPLEAAPQPAGFWQRRVPVLTAIATGFFGMILGFVLGILITIEYPDGTKAVVSAPKGSKITIEEGEGKKAGDMNGKLDHTPELSKELNLEPIIPLMFAVVNESREIQFDKLIYTHQILLDDNDEVEVLQDKHGLWFPVRADFDSTMTHKVRGQNYVIVSAKADDQLRWSEIQSKVMLAQYAGHSGVMLEFDDSLAKRMEKLTGSNLNRRLAIIVDGRVVTAPRILTKSSNRVVITGNLTRRQFSTLMSAAGPAPVLPDLNRMQRDGTRRNHSSGFPRKGIKVPGATNPEPVRGEGEEDSVDHHSGSIQQESEPDGLDPHGLSKFRNVALALHACETKFGHFPAAQVRLKNPNDNKMYEHPISWRVAILPFLGHQALYDQYRLDEAWDSDANRALLKKMPSVYSLQGVTDQEGYTRIQAPVGPDRVFRKFEATKLVEISDGLSETLLLLEAQPIPWTKPVDLNGRIITGPGPVRGAMADGSTFWHAKMGQTFLDAIVTRNGGENVDVSDDGYARSVEHGLSKNLPNAKLKIRVIDGDSAILSGYVTNEEELKAAVEFVEQFFPVVLNNLHIIPGETASDVTVPVRSILDRRFPNAELKLVLRSSDGESKDHPDVAHLSGHVERKEHLQQVIDTVREYFDNVVSEVTVSKLGSGSSSLGEANSGSSPAAGG